MPLIERYVLKRTARIFLMTLCALTAALWVTQVLRELDVVTAKGQAIWVFLLMTFLGLPALVQVVAPIALLVGTVIALSSLTNDSELPIISAAGASNKAVSRPHIVLGIAVMLAVALAHHFLTPASLSAFRTILGHVRADVIASLAQDVGFRELESGLTMSIRQRTSDGGFRGVFINDERDPQETRTFSATHGVLLDQGGEPFLILQDGDVIREDRVDGGGGVVTFDTYALDLGQFDSRKRTLVYEAMERSTPFLLNPPADDAYISAHPQRASAEIHDRLTAPLYTLVFVLVALGFLGRPRTTRQGRNLSIAAVVVICLAFRTAGFAALAVSREVGGAEPFMYAVPFAGIAFGIWVNVSDTRVWVTPGMERLANALAEAARRLLPAPTATTGGQ